MFDILAAWWEPGSANSFDVGDLAAIFAFILAVVGALTGLSRWWISQMRKIVREEIEEFTAPIQPHANGGLSLPDVAKRVTRLEDTLGEIKADSSETKELLLKFIVNNEQ